jgi:transposase-like protein
MRLYEEIGNAGIVCRCCGIFRPTLRKWWQRYRADGVAGLETRSSRPHRSPGRKVLQQEEVLILELRRSRRLGIKRLHKRTHPRACSQARARYHPQGPDPARRALRWKHIKRDSRPIPGDRVQVDVCKIRPNIYQYTAIDDGLRFQVVGLYPRRTATNTVHFLQRVLEEMPFAIHRPAAARPIHPRRSRGQDLGGRIQTDRGQEFFAYKVQDQLRDWHPPHPATLPASERQGRTSPAYGPGRVLADRRPQGCLTARPTADGFAGA